MGKRKTEKGNPKSTPYDTDEGEILVEEPATDSVVIYPSPEGKDHDSLIPNLNSRAVNILGLKRFANESLPGNSPLRNVLLSEKDQLTPKDFLAKMDVWMRLL